MRTRIGACLCFALMFIIFSNPIVLGNSISNQNTSASIHKAVDYLHSVQNQDGGFPVKPGGSSSITSTCWAIMALEANSEDISSSTWVPAGVNPVEYLLNTTLSLESTNDYARLLLALTAAGQNPVHHNINLAEKIVSFQQCDGHFCQPDLQENDFINAHLWSIIALTSAGYDIPNKELAKQWLIDHQNEDGGFGWVQGVASDSDDTGIAIQALVILGQNPENSQTIKKATDYLQSCQEEDGGFNSGNNWLSSGSNAASTSWVLQGLIAAGEDPSDELWIKGSNNPTSFLLKLQDEDGCYNWKPDVAATPVIITAHTMMALAEKPYPINIVYYNKYQSLPANTNTFIDLSNEYWAYETVMNLVNEGILKGYPDGTFQPEKTSY